MADIGSFERTDDNTIKHTYTRIRNVKVRDMWQRAKETMESLDNMPEKDSEPQQKHLDYWNEMVEQERQQIPSLVEVLQWIYYWSGEAEEQDTLTDEEESKRDEIGNYIEKFG